MKTLIFILLLLPMYAWCQDGMEQHYKIYSSAKQKLITIDDIVNDMANADVLFFGEEHNDSTGHYLEYALFKKLSNKFPGDAALSMEMFETDCQLPLNEYLEDLIREKSLITDARTWPNYKDYKPMVDYAKLNHIPVIAANAPSRYTHLVSVNGLMALDRLSPAAQSYIPPPPIDAATGPYYEKFTAIMGGHDASGGMQMYQAQSLWDATMGWSIAGFNKTHKDYKILQINGGFHSEEKLGAVTQLKKYAPKIRVLNIAAYSDDSFDNPDWSKFTKLGDYIVLTDPKYCRGLFRIFLMQ
jgi:uncharacterized iron-regulated protein